MSDSSDQYPTYDAPPVSGLHQSPDATAQEQGIWRLYIAVWIIVTLAGLGLAMFFGKTFLGAILIGIVTLMGVVIKPMFGLVLLCAVAPIGKIPGLSPFGESFGLEKAVAILFAFGVLLNLFIGRVRLNFRGPVVGLLAALTLLCGLSIVWARFPTIAMSYAFTMFQISVYVLCIASVVRDTDSLLWPLRAFAGVSTLAVMLPKIMGAAEEVGKYERFTLGVAGSETVMDANGFCSALAIGLLTSIYLARRDPSKTMRMFWIASSVILPIGILMTGSRGGLIATAAAFALPMMSLRQLRRNPRLAAGVLALCLVVAIVGVIGIKYVIKGPTAERLTDVSYAMYSLGYRVTLVKEAISYVAAHPLGAGIACFRSAGGHIVHNDVGYLFSNLGYLGALIYILVVIRMFIAVNRIRDGWQQLYARCVVTFLVVMSLSIEQIFFKHPWMFFTFVGILALNQYDSTYALEDSQLEEYAYSDQYAGAVQ